MPLHAVHRALDAIFAATRELILIGAGAEAAVALAVYRDLTAAHAAAEEALLLPLLGDDARWPAELYLGQHRKLLAAIDATAAALPGLVAGAPGWRALALAALDRAAVIAHVAEHHHLAEEQALFVEVAARAPDRLDAVAAHGRADLARTRAALVAATAALR